MKRKLKFKAQALFLALLLLGGCTLFEGCEIVIEMIGRLTRTSYGSTVHLAMASNIYLDILDDGILSDDNTTLAEDDYYQINDTYLYIRTKEGENYVDPASVSGGLASLEEVSIKIDISESGTEVLSELTWTGLDTTPVGSGSLYMKIEGAVGSATLTSINYDSTTSTETYGGYPISGTTVFSWETGVFLLSSFDVALTFSVSSGVPNASGTVGVNGQTTGWGTAELTATPYSEGEPFCTAVVTDSNGNETVFSGDIDGDTK